MRRRALSEPTTRAAAIGQRARRSGLLTTIIAVHALGILWLASRPPATPPVTQPTLSMIDVDAEEPGSPAQAPPKPPVSVPDAVAPVIILPSPLPVAAPDAPPALAAPGPAGTGGAGQGGCALAMAAGQAILADTAAMAELDGLPPQARTKADAVMLWDGRWQVPGVSIVEASEAVPGAIRRVIQQLVRSAAPECRDAPALGPQFIPIPAPTRTTIVVIGSGAWRWADLVRPEEDCSASAATSLCRPAAPIVAPKRTRAN